MDPKIIQLEQVAAGLWRAPVSGRLGSWLLRAADGFTGRANSALPLGDPGVPLPAAVAAVSDWYRTRGLPPMAQARYARHGFRPAYRYHYRVAPAG